MFLQGAEESQEVALFITGICQYSLWINFKSIFLHISIASWLDIESGWIPKARAKTRYTT